MSDRAAIRDDFVRRLFAVAVSVGFATTLIRMHWVESGSLPNRGEWEQLTILATGMMLTVLSWDGYLASIKKKPLNGYLRFAIDIVLVFIYMFFLISSRQSDFWLPIIALIFILYVIWDFMTVREHMGSYDLSLKPTDADDTYRARLSSVLRVYGRGFLDRAGTGRGPVITVSWAIYFCILAAINASGSATYQVFVGCAFTILGLILYRQDKDIKICGNAIAGFPMWFRIILIVLLLLIVALYFCCFKIH